MNPSARHSLSLSAVLALAVIAGCAWLGAAAPLSATDVLTSTPTSELVRLLTAIGADDDLTCTAVLDQHPELATVEFKLDEIGTEYAPKFRLPVAGEVFNHAQLSTALHFAAKLGRVKIATHLIQCGADARQLDGAGVEPLVSAFQCDDNPTLRRQMVQLLLAHGADANRADPDGWRPLHFLMWRSTTRDDVEVIHALGAAGADVNAVAPDIGTPLMLLVEHGPYSRWWGGWRAGCAALVAEGADVNRQDEQGQTALMRVADVEYERPTEQIQFLMENGADLSIRDNRGWTVQDYAFAHGADSEGVQIALYPYYGKLPGPVQMTLFWLVLLAVVGWVRRRQRRQPPWTVERWAAEQVLPAQWEEIVRPEEPTALLAGHLKRRDSYDWWFRWSLVPFAAGLTLTLLVFQDSMHLRAWTTKPLLIYAGLYCLGYPALHLRLPYAKTLLLALGTLYTALGACFMSVQGAVFWERVNEPVIGVMWYCGAGLFGVQVLLLLWLTYLRARIGWVDYWIGRQCAQAIRAEDHTGIEAPAGWDEGRSREKP